MKDLSSKNKYYIPKHRRLELEHFTRQYPMWKMIEKGLTLGYLPKPKVMEDVSYKRGSLDWIDPVGDKATLKVLIQNRIGMVDLALKKIDELLRPYILKNVAYGKTYDAMAAEQYLPMSRHEFYDEVRHFYHELSQIRR